MVYEKCVYYWNRKGLIIKQMTFCGNKNRDCAACLKNGVNFLVA
jgi:hypothetical protein